MKPRILYLLATYPQISQTYIKVEIESLEKDYDIMIVTLRKPNIPYREHRPHSVIKNMSSIVSVVREFKPAVIHGHWLHMAKRFHQISEETGVPWTIRTHSFDVLHRPNRSGWFPRMLALGRGRIDPTTSLPSAVAPFINQDNCLGILSFPFARRILEGAGIRGEKIIDCYPVIDYKKFLNTAPNGDDVMNVGACIQKKKMTDFIDLACQVPGRKFRLYPLGYEQKSIRAYNDKYGRPVELSSPVEPDLMPAEYKRHQWLVYTASADHNTVGWPLALAEAQASGVGVCMANIRPDIESYLGGAGYLYNDIRELTSIIAGPVPEKIRELGFEQARKSDIEAHKQLLTDLWRPFMV